LGDIDGVLVVPREAGEEAFTNAIEKARSEKLVQKAIEESMSACEALAKFGVG
jgi:regulator of RNase E activity RraA